MELDADCLLEARTENLERLAGALGVRLPVHRGDGRAYARRLVRALLKALDEDRRRGRREARLGARAAGPN
jgi:hypothetical protein